MKRNRFISHRNYTTQSVVEFGMHLTLLYFDTVNQMLVKFLLERDEKNYPKPQKSEKQN